MKYLILSVYGPFLNNILCIKVKEEYRASCTFLISIHYYYIQKICRKYCIYFDMIIIIKVYMLITNTLKWFAIILIQPCILNQENSMTKYTLTQLEIVVPSIIPMYLHANITKVVLNMLAEIIQHAHKLMKVL